MANRQYIGARYVPKFDGEWANKSYEALTVVSYLNDSYTSKKPVPVNIGNPRDNNEYWALTGNFNSQLHALTEKVDELAENTFNTQAYSDFTRVYVDGLDGDDTNEGSINKPFKTLDKACELFNKGVTSLYVHLLTDGTYTLSKTEFNGITFHLYAESDNCIINWVSPYAGKIYNCHLNFQCTTENGLLSIRNPYNVGFESMYTENCAVTFIKVKLMTRFAMFGCSFSLQKCHINATRLYWCTGTVDDLTFINDNITYPAIYVGNESYVTFRNAIKHLDTLSENSDKSLIECVRSTLRLACTFTDGYLTMNHKYKYAIEGYNSELTIDKLQLNNVLPNFATDGYNYNNFYIYYFETIFVNDAILNASNWALPIERIEDGSDLNDVLTPGKYFTPYGSTAQTIQHTPYTNSGFKLTVSNLSSKYHIRQTLEGINKHGFYIRDIVTTDSGVSTISKWYLFEGVEQNI